MAGDLGQRIRRAREREGLTLAALAIKVGVTPPTIWQWENGQEPSEANRKKLEIVLGSLTPHPQRQGGSVEDVSSFGSWLREQRVQIGLSVPELASRAKVSAPAIYNLESGKSQNPQSMTRDKLAKALEVEVPSVVVAETVESQSVAGLGPLTDFQPHDRNEWPKCPGVYVFYDVSQRPVYVGKAASIYVRLKAHEDRFWFKPPIVEYASYIEVVDRSLRDQLEQTLIRFLKSNAVINKYMTEDFED